MKATGIVNPLEYVNPAVSWFIKRKLLRGFKDFIAVHFEILPLYHFEDRNSKSKIKDSTAAFKLSRNDYIDKLHWTNTQNALY